MRFSSQILRFITIITLHLEFKLSAFMEQCPSYPLSFLEFGCLVCHMPFLRFSGFQFACFERGSVMAIWPLCHYYEYVSNRSWSAIHNNKYGTRGAKPGPTHCTKDSFAYKKDMRLYLYTWCLTLSVFFFFAYLFYNLFSVSLLFTRSFFVYLLHVYSLCLLYKY